MSNTRILYEDMKYFNVYIDQSFDTVWKSDIFNLNSIIFSINWEN